MKLSMILDSQYKDPSTFMDRNQIGTQYSTTDVNDTVHHLYNDVKPMDSRQEKLQIADNNIKNNIRRKRRMPRRSFFN